MKTAVFEQMLPGGQTAGIVALENYPGFPEGVNGADLMLAVVAQAEKAGAELRYTGVEKLDKSGGFWVLKASGPACP